MQTKPPKGIRFPLEKKSGGAAEEKSGGGAAKKEDAPRADAGDAEYTRSGSLVPASAPRFHISELVDGVRTVTKVPFDSELHVELCSAALRVCLPLMHAHNAAKGTAWQRDGLQQERAPAVDAT